MNDEEPQRDRRVESYRADALNLDSSYRDNVYAQAPGSYLSFNRGTEHRPRRKHHKRRTASEKLAAANEALRKEDASDSQGNDRQGLAPGQRVQFLLDQPDEAEESHPVFTEMEELQGQGDSATWKEVARWVKFEEDVEEGGDRWSKPHVATLSLHSLFELRVCMVNGTVILDMRAESLQQIIDIMLDNMISNKQLEFMYRDDVRDCLLRRKTHQYESHKHKDNQGKLFTNVRSMTDVARNFSSKNLQQIDHQVPLPQKSVTEPTGVTPQSKLTGNSSVPKLSSAVGPKESTVKFEHDPKGNMHFFKKLPAGVEASNVLVGEVDFLSHHVSTFIRLAKPLMLEGLTEVPVASRFLFILLGPIGHAQQYHEIGRAIATLMSDEVFHDVAYKAHSTEDLLDGVDEFLDQVTVLPPGEWDPNIRIEPPTRLPSQSKRLKSVASEAKLKIGMNASPDGDPPMNGDLDNKEEEEGGHSSDPTLKRTGRWFGGLIQDVKRKLPYLVSDYKDALNMQCLATIFFMYFALLAPIVTFGGLLEEATGQRMAALENLLAGCVCGVTYHIFAAQPLTVIGSTGPVLVLETIIYEMCGKLGVDYLCFRLWINCWTAAILIFMVATDASALVTYITRFTEESFATLIAVIFIFEAIKKLLKIKNQEERVSEYNEPAPGAQLTLLNRTCVCESQSNETFSRSWFNASMKKHRWTNENLRIKPWALYNGTNITGIEYDDLPLDYCKELKGQLVGDGCYEVQDVFLMSALLMIGTFLLAMCLKKGKTSPYFPTIVRQIASDFAVMIAIVVMVLFDLWIGVATPKLNVPSTFAPTLPGRGWLVHPFKNPVWTYFLAIIPALLACILIFMDQQITAVIVNRKENKLKKGSGYHLDLLVIAIQMIVVGFLGIPIYVAATVLSINHVNSLRVESESRAPGEVASFVGCREQRVTGIVTFLLIGLSVFMTGALQMIPMPVLYGVFLYMGISALNGIQLFDRVLLLLMPMKHQPDYMYLRHVPINQVHFFTAFQIGCLALLWVIKSVKATSITFPIMLVIMVVMRKGIEYIYNPKFLHVLDDRMPEFHLRKKEDAKKKRESIKSSGSGSDRDEDLSPKSEDSNAIPLRSVATEAHLHIPMASGNVMKIPLSSLEDSTKSIDKPMNISDEMKKSQMYKHISDCGQQKNGNQGEEENPLLGSKKKDKFAV